MKFGYVLFLAVSASALTIGPRHFKGKAQLQSNNTANALGRRAGAPTVVAERDVDMEAVARELDQLVARRHKHQFGNGNQPNNTAQAVNTKRREVVHDTEIERLATRVHELEGLVARHHKDKAKKKEQIGKGHKDGKAKHHNQGAGGTSSNNTARAVDGEAVAREVNLFARAKAHG